MNEKIQKKLLLAVDGSENSMEVVTYVSRITAFQGMKAVLFHVHSKIPDAYWDLETNSSVAWRMSEARAWEKEREKTVGEFMKRAEKLLLRAGFPKESISVKIQNRKKGFARDIIKEAKGGYDGVLVGRKGMSNLKDLVLGGIATKLIGKTSFAPILVIGKKPQAGSVLLALDGSKNASRAVAYVGKMLGEADFTAKLVHVVRSDHSEYVNKKETEMNRVFGEAKDTLVESGFASDKVTSKIITGVKSRAAAIVQEAKDGAYGTIVVGRRGLSNLSTFVMGRVSNKLIHLSKNQAVWVVN